MAGNDSHIQQGEVDSLVEAIEELKAKIAAKDARIAELEAALRPFSDAADVAEEIRAVKIGTDEIRYPVRMGDLRAARALLPADGEKDAPEEEGGDDAYIVPPDETSWGNVGYGD